MIETKTMKVEVSVNTANWLNALAELEKAYNVVYDAAVAQYGDELGYLNKEVAEKIYEPYHKLQQQIEEFMVIDFLEDGKVVNKFQASLIA